MHVSMDINIRKEYMKKQHAIRHGEIMLVPVANVPVGTTTKHDLFIVGHSETGHHHVLEGKFEVTETDKQELYFRLFEPAKLVHKKATDQHRTLTIPAGIYQRFHDTEYSPFDGLVRKVRD